VIWPTSELKLVNQARCRWGRISFKLKGCDIEEILKDPDHHLFQTLEIFVNETIADGSWKTNENFDTEVRENCQAPSH
jgi:hypothetical protein